MNNQSDLCPMCGYRTLAPGQVICCRCCPPVRQKLFQTGCQAIWKDWLPWLLAFLLLFFLSYFYH